MSVALQNTDTPLRSQASPRSSRANSAQSSYSFGVSSEPASEADTESSELQSPKRGRNLVRIPAIRSTNRRATTIHQERPRIHDWDNSMAQQRLFSRDLTAEPQEITDSALDPLPLGVERYRSSLSDELYKAATWDTFIDVSRFGDHRDTFAILGLRHLQSRRIELPDTFFKKLLYYIDFDTYLAIRLSCRSWSEAITKARPTFTPPICQLPVEVLEKIFFHLDPVDFNAARHTCRAWMIISLEERLLALMLRRGGWWAAAKADIDLQEQLEERTAESTNEEWMLSKRLATECSLRPDWKGNGFSEGSLSLSSNDQKSPISFYIAATTDFSELSSGYIPSRGEQDGSALHFTVSACNRFLLIAEGCVVYIYAINDNASLIHQDGGYLSCFATVICPHRVLAVSMDTSLQRFAVAALLEGRIGFVCDISKASPGSRKLPTDWDSPTLPGDSDTSSPQSSTDQVMRQTTKSNECDQAHVAHDRNMAQAVADATLSEMPCGRESLPTPLDAPSSSQDYDHLGGHVPRAISPRSVYQNLCSYQDPPRSVAICPQRRCVAFGCATGIELHWIDALTGQDLNRWFILTAPSDFLYFLPPRPSVDNARKLRLISSAAHPKEREGMQGRFFPRSVPDAARYQSMSWDEDVHGNGFGNTVWRGSGWCDHYQAVPVSDGWNILFTDPDDGILYLGSDAPSGARATRLSRKFMFVGPTDRDNNVIVPTVYTSGIELRWGVRVVVGYGESIWLFVVPPDLYFKNRTSGKGDIVEHDEIDYEEPTKILGVEIGRTTGLVDVAIDATGGDLTIWAFAAYGMAYTWQIRGEDRAEVQRVVDRNGTVMPLYDVDGDVFMHNTSSVELDLNSNASLPPPAHHSHEDRIFDTAVGKALEEGGFEPEFEAAGGTFAIHAPPLRDRWSEDETDWVPEYLGHMENGVDDDGVGVDLRDMSRLEIEVIGGSDHAVGW